MDSTVGISGGLTYYAIGKLFEQLAEEFQPGVTIPADVALLLSSMRVPHLEDEAFFIYNPCLLPMEGRISLTYQAYFLLKTLYARSGDPKDQKDRSEILYDLASPLIPEEREWEEVVREDPLFDYQYKYSFKCRPTTSSMRMASCIKASGVISKPPTGDIVQAGGRLLGIKRHCLVHSWDPNVVADTAVSKLHPYTQNHIVQHQHWKLPLVLPKILLGMLNAGRIKELGISKYFPVHPHAYQPV